MENVNENEQNTHETETSENATSANSEESTVVVTEAQAVIKIEGQEIELEAALAQDDKLLKTILQPYYATLENANITRQIKDGKLTVSIVKQAQHKG